MAAPTLQRNLSSGFVEPGREHQGDLAPSWCFIPDGLDVEVRALCMIVQFFHTKFILLFFFFFANRALWCWNCNGPQLPQSAATNMEVYCNICISLILRPQCQCFHILFPQSCQKEYRRMVTGHDINLISPEITCLHSSLSLSIYSSVSVFWSLQVVLCLLHSLMCFEFIPQPTLIRRLALMTGRKMMLSCPRYLLRFLWSETGGRTALPQASWHEETRLQAERRQIKIPEWTETD